MCIDFYQRTILFFEHIEHYIDLRFILSERIILAKKYFVFSQLINCSFKINSIT